MDTSFLFNSILHIVVGFFIGWGIGITGIGALIIPALIHVLRLAPVSAVGTGLAFAVVTKIGGTIYHYRLKTLRIRRALYFLGGGIPGVLFASKMVNFFIKRCGLVKINIYLQVIIGIILFITASMIIFQLLTTNQEDRRNHIIESKQKPVPFSKKIMAVFFGFLVGIFMGTTSIGGGVIIIPILMIFLDASPIQAVGTSIFISVFLAAAGSLVYLYHGHVDIFPTVLLCLGSVPGVWIGSHFSKKIHGTTLTIIVTIIIIICGVTMFF